MKEGINKVNFECPHCHDEGDLIDERWLFRSERIQSSDALNIDPISNIEGKMELWYCCFCGKYFRAYYKLSKITKLEETEDDISRP